MTVALTDQAMTRASAPVDAAAVDHPPLTGIEQLHERPRVGTILRHLGLSLLMANVIPGVLFYLCLVGGNVWTALIAALAWCYGAMAWRVKTKRPISGLLLLTLIGLTAKTAFALISGSTFIYFLQPAVTDGVVATTFLLSLATARPIVARLAADFYPMDTDVAQRPRVQRLFWRLTWFWAATTLVKAAVTLWLLESMPTVTFVAAKSLSILVIVVTAAAITVTAAVRVARSEGLLHGSPVAAAG